jgi:hypothetical protein
MLHTSKYIYVAYVLLFKILSVFLQFDILIRLLTSEQRLTY